MEQSPQAENDSVLTPRDVTTTQAASSEHPLASTSAQGGDGPVEQHSLTGGDGPVEQHSLTGGDGPVEQHSLTGGDGPVEQHSLTGGDGPVEQHSDLSSRGRARKKNPKFMDYETDLDLNEENPKQQRKSPARKSPNKGKATQKGGRGRKSTVKPIEDGDQETSEKQTVESTEEPPKKTPAGKRTRAKRRPAKKTKKTAKAVEEVPSTAMGAQTPAKQPKPRGRKRVTKQEVQDVGPAETLADQERSTSLPEEEPEESVPPGGRPRRSAAKAALKYLHSLAREVLGGPSSYSEAQLRSQSGASTPVSEPDPRRKAPKGGRGGWGKGRKRKRRDSGSSDDGDEEFLPGGKDEDAEDEEEEQVSEGELESDFEPESRAHHRSSRMIIHHGKRALGIAPNGLANNTLQPCWEATQSNQKFREKHQSSWVFPDWIPSTNDWSVVPQSDVEEYLPQEMLSAAFKISREGLSKEETPLHNLNRFEAVEPHPERWDALMFTGGPVWAMEWCPSPDGCTDQQYVALACHRGMDDLHCANEKYPGPGLIQLWDLGKLEYDSSPTSSPSLVYGLAQDKGFIWQLKWCPSGAWELPTFPRKAPYLPRLGLLAAATSTGVVTIYSLPHPQALLPGKVPANAEESSQVPPVFKAKGVITLKLGSFRAPHNEMSGQVLCMDWSAMKEHSIMALGFYDGLVGLWNLSSTSSFMRMREPDRSLTFLPYRCFQAHDNSVRSLAFCPASSDLLVTAGDDRILKTWDLTRLYGYINAHKRHLTTEIFWPLTGSGIFLSQESTYAPNGSQGMHFIDVGYNSSKAAYVVPRMATMWSLSFSDWMNCLLTSDTMGEVIFDILPRLHANINKTKQNQLRRFPVFFTDMEPLEANASDEPTGGEGEGETEGPVAEQTENVERPGDAEGLTQTYREAVKQYYLHFRDADMRSFKNFQNRTPWKRMRKTEYGTKVDFDIMTMGALHKVRFNPNMSSHTWLVSGGQAGLVRLHCLRSMSREDTKKLLTKCKKQFKDLYSPQAQSHDTETVTAAQPL